jgi:hypothetical protein
MTTSTKKRLWLSALILGTACAAMCLKLLREPSGYVSSFSLFPHSGLDVANFYDGKVTLETCCGDQNWGTYEKTANGSWVWTMRNGERGPTVGIYRVEPGLFWMTFTDLNVSHQPFTLRRRAFKKYPF